MRGPTRRIALRWAAAALLLLAAVTAAVWDPLGLGLVLNPAPAPLSSTEFSAPGSSSAAPGPITDPSSALSGSGGSGSAQKKSAAQPPPPSKAPAPASVAPPSAAQPDPGKADPAQAGALSLDDARALEADVFARVNALRAEVGAPALTLNSGLSDLAREKSRDMAENGYFNHTSPTYGSPFDMMQNAGFSYRAAGENIAMNTAGTGESAFNQWRNSTGHYNNMVSADFTQIGIGVYKAADGKYYWTQMFIG